MVLVAHAQSAPLCTVHKLKRVIELAVVLMYDLT